MCLFDIYISFLYQFSIYYISRYLAIQYPIQKSTVTHATDTKTIITPNGALILYYLYVIFLYNTTMFIMLHYYLCYIIIYVTLLFMLHYDEYDIIKNYTCICCIEGPNFFCSH